MWNSFRDSSNWGGYNYRPVQVGVKYNLNDGRTIKVEKVFPSRSKLERAVNFARRNFLILLKVQVGNPNVITSREDFLAVKPENVPYGVEVVALEDEFWRNPKAWLENSRNRVYNDDNH